MKPICLQQTAFRRLAASLAKVLLLSMCLGSATYAQVIETEDGFTVWRQQVNSVCTFNDHDYTVQLMADPADLSDISYSMSVLDVDYLDPQGCAGGPEVDLMYLNGNYLGIMTGANNSWSMSSWPLSRSQLVSGNNTIHIDTDSPGTGCWCVAVGYVELRARVGFSVVSHTPVADDRNRDFRADRLDLTVTFSSAYAPASLTHDSFRLEFRDAAGVWRQVSGSFEALAPERFRFVPGSALKDGVRYRATVRGGSSGVRSSGGTELAEDTVWFFQTVPELPVSDVFNYGSGSVCPPSSAPCPGLELAVFQVARNAPMVTGGKAATARLYLRWRRHADVHVDDQVRELQVEAALTVGSLVVPPVQSLVRRPDLYTAAERAAAAHTVNIPHMPLGDFEYAVTVRPLPQTNAQPVSYTQTRHLDPAPFSLNLNIPHYAVRAGDWFASGVPTQAAAEGTIAMALGAQLISDTFPVLGATVSPQTQPSISYGPIVGSTSTLDCGALRRVNGCVIPGRTEQDCIVQRLLGMLAGRSFVTATVPPSVCPNRPVLLTGGRRVLLHMFDRGVTPEDIAREVARIYGTVDRDPSVNVEGFQVRTGTNRSFVESPAQAISLMHRTRQPSGTQWIDNDDYATLRASVSSPNTLRASTASPYLILSGYVDVMGGVADLSPGFLQEVPNNDPSPFGFCRVELLDASGAVLAEDRVMLGTDGPPTPAPVPQTFLVSLPWSESARVIQLSCGGTLLASRTRGVQPPSVDFQGLANGAVLSGVQTLSWSGSDADGDSLSYQLQVSGDEGASWTPLTPLLDGTGFDLDTSTLPPGNTLLRIMATDGFDTVWAVRSVSITNPLRVLAVLPAADSLNAGHRLDVTVLPTAELSETGITQSTLRLLENGVTPVTGKVAWHRASRALTFTPGAPLKPVTTYVARLSPPLQDRYGNSLGAAYQWSFTTAPDTTPPGVVRTSPAPGGLGVPLNPLVHVRFSEAMRASTLNTSSLQVFDAQGQSVSGRVVVSASRQAAYFAVSPPLAPEREYTARLSATATDAAGNPLEGDLQWRFTTGTTTSPGPRILGNFGDQALDVDGDGLFDNLTLSVDVEVQRATQYNLNGRLLDSRGKLLAWQSTGSVQLEAGVHTLKLVFSSVPIRSSGEDGPYTLDALTLYGTNTPTVSDTWHQPFQTAHYAARSFHSVLSLRRLPDPLFDASSPGTQFIALRDYTAHTQLPTSSVTYHLLFNTNPRLGVSLGADGVLALTPAPGPAFESEVLIEARDTLGNRVTSGFRASVRTP